MNDCLPASQCMYTFQDEDAENRQPYNSEDPDAIQLPPAYGDMNLNPICNCQHRTAYFTSAT